MWLLGQQSSRKLTPAISATIARDAPVSEHEDAAEILRHSRLGPEPFQSGTPPRQSRTVLARPLDGTSRVADARGQTSVPIAICASFGEEFAFEWRHHPHSEGLTVRPIIPGTELIPIASLPALYNPRRRTVALDTTDDEFALFIHWARSLRLDPLRRQVHAFVFHKHDPKKLRLSLATPIEGFRAIAARTGNYRPDEIEPGFINDEAPKSETNPAGLVSCSVRVWQYATGNGSPSRASPAGRNSRPSRRSGSITSRPSARSSTSPAGGEICPSSCSPNARKRKPSLPDATNSSYYPRATASSAGLRFANR
jgi:hypothetical protein